MSAPADIAALREAKAKAKQHRMFVVEKPVGTGTEYVLYRILPDRNLRIGMSSTPAALRRLVSRSIGGAARTKE